MKGIVLLHVLYACYSMCHGSGACLNPALGMAQTSYMIGLYNGDPKNHNQAFADCIWVYMIMPFIGSFLAAIFFKVHQSMGISSSNNKGGAGSKPVSKGATPDKNQNS